jgi:hypothetical protein
LGDNELISDLHAFPEGACVTQLLLRADTTGPASMGRIVAIDEIKRRQSKQLMDCSRLEKDNEGLHVAPD